MILTIEGHSDDIVSYSVDGAPEELYLPDINFEGLHAGTLIVSHGFGREFYVHVLYDGCWSFAVSKADEDHPAPPEPDRHWRDYSEVLSFRVPKGTTLKWKDKP